MANILTTTASDTPANANLVDDSDTNDLTDELPNVVVLFLSALLFRFRLHS